MPIGSVGHVALPSRKGSRSQCAIRSSWGFSMVPIRVDDSSKMVIIEIIQTVMSPTRQIGKSSAPLEVGVYVVKGDSECRGWNLETPAS
jgi:hypothetical protein